MRAAAADSWNVLLLRAVTPQTGWIGLRELVSVPGHALGPLLQRLRESSRATECVQLLNSGHVSPGQTDQRPG
jgi:hypothetical protein